MEPIQLCDIRRLALLVHFVSIWHLANVALGPVAVGLLIGQCELSERNLRRKLPTTRRSFRETRNRFCNPIYLASEACDPIELIDRLRAI